MRSAAIPKPAIAHAGNGRDGAEPSAAGCVRTWRFGFVRGVVAGAVPVAAGVVVVVSCLVSAVEVVLGRLGCSLRVVALGGGGGGGGGSGAVVVTIVLGVVAVVVGVVTVVIGVVAVVAVMVARVVSFRAAAGASAVATAKPQLAVAAARQP